MLITVLLVLLNLGLENYLISIVPGLSRGQLQALVLATLIVPFLITVWQLAGIWHSAFAHVGRGGKSGWALAAKLSVVLGFIRTTIELVKVVPEIMPLFGV